MVKGDAKKTLDAVALIDAIFVNEARKRVIGGICVGLGATFTVLGLIILTTPLD